MKKIHYELYYRNDTLSGFYKCYYQNRTLAGFGQYCAGKEVGIWYYFDDSGHIYMEISKIEHRPQKIYTEGRVVTYEHKAYIKSYDRNGVCSEEGFAVYDDPEIDFVKIGKWKYHND